MSVVQRRTRTRLGCCISIPFERNANSLDPPSSNRIVEYSLYRPLLSPYHPRVMCCKRITCDREKLRRGEPCCVSSPSGNVKSSSSPVQCTDVNSQCKFTLDRIEVPMSRGEYQATMSSGSATGGSFWWCLMGCRVKASGTAGY